MARISVARIDKQYTSPSGGVTPVLRDLSLDVADGEFLTLLGPSGCGKSTLIRIIAGLERAESGSIAIDGVCVDSVRPSERNVAMVFQSYALYPHLTVAANLALPLRMRRLTSTQRLPWLGRCLPSTRLAEQAIKAEVHEIARMLGLSALLERKPGQLSGGQRQRVALARAMVRHPVAFLMDEPLSNLDAHLRAQMRTELTELHRRLGVTFVYVTHDQAEAMSMSSRIAVMLEGRIHQVGTPREVYEDPETLAVASFLGEPRINVLNGSVRSDGSLQVLDFVLPAQVACAPGSEVSVAIRPEALSVAATGLGATVQRVEYLGSGALLHAQLRDGAPICVRVDAGVALRAGERVRLAPAGAVLVFDADGRRVREPAIQSARRMCS